MERVSAVLSKLRSLRGVAPRDLEAQASGGYRDQKELDDLPEQDKKDHPQPWRAYIRSGAWLRPMAVLVTTFAASLALVVVLFWRLPSLAALRTDTGEGVADPFEAEELSLTLPRTFDELATVRRALAAYESRYAVRLAAFLLAAQIFLQTFLVPGSIVINVLAGSLYSFPVAVLFSTIGSTLGAGANYVLLRSTLKDALWAAFPGRLAAFAGEVRRHRAHLFYYMLFLRVTPLLPAWFINLAAPLVEVPLLAVFLPATALGHQPINVLTAQAGRALSTLSSARDLYSPANVAFLIGVGLLALAPVVVRRSKLGTGEMVTNLGAATIGPRAPTLGQPPGTAPGELRRE